MYYTLDGDLCQMKEQAAFLRQRGFKLTQIYAYPALTTEEDYKRAVKCIFENRVDGWWNYRRVSPEIEIHLLKARKEHLLVELEEIEEMISKYSMLKESLQ